MNPETNKFEKLINVDDDPACMGGGLAVPGIPESIGRLLRPDGTPVPKHWSIFTEGEDVVVKDYMFKVAHIGESYLVLEPVGIPKIGKGKKDG